MYKGVIFDIDGTLVDSNDAHARAWVRAFADEQLTVSFDQVRPLIGMGSDQMIPRLTEIQKDTPEFKRLSERWKQHFQAEELPHLKAHPGVRALVERLQARGLRLIVGTSADEALVADLLKVAGVADLLTEYTTASDVEASKPEPDIVLAAVSKLGLTPGEVLMVGDTPFDIASARKAGVATIALRCGGDTRFEGAVAVYADPQDWLEQLDQSPLGKA
ncbi:HAD family hydrolase [Deinococcus sp. Arct2-2]|uniref:HAD family hydrolase n=1 Tax=Deinococcus sp. Arct2-2 TaxID=2568653 RepID=UPI0010A4E7C2|nr:HAD family hydrolase [Deinococcus sp. Arct2-2]THF71656.1 HAD family hydrolase [Deinococcus sp. Arct2-2]